MKNRNCFTRIEQPNRRYVFPKLGFYLLLSNSSNTGYESPLHEPSGVCNCGDKGHALVYEQTSNSLIEGSTICVCKEHYAISKLQAAMKGFTFEENHRPQPSCVEQLAGITIETVIRSNNYLKLLPTVYKVDFTLPRFFAPSEDLPDLSNGKIKKVYLRDSIVSLQILLPTGIEHLISMRINTE